MRRVVTVPCKIDPRTFNAPWVIQLSLLIYIQIAYHANFVKYNLT